MSVWLLLAVVLLLVIGVAHSWLGERYILMRLFRRSDLPRLFGSDVFTRRVLRFAWHLTSVAWWGFAATLWAVGAGSARDVSQVIAATFLLSGVITLVSSRGRHVAWIVFMLIALGAWMGAPP